VGGALRFDGWPRARPAHGRRTRRRADLRGACVSDTDERGVDAAVAWQPQPMDTDQVQLSAAIEPLVEALARNVHEVWAAARQAEGWTYGPSRDDAEKKHPGLVPYEALSEQERDYDRRTAMETLRTITALGFRIEAPVVVAHRPSFLPLPAEPSDSPD